eukprot:TRINITY_DN1221_c0_g1_i2.p1 TRINITY_DN1221_c0_g1~~TRINITY_DN1221_c0_g1_i2.p1  ORF type:complete len:868 (+),score=105.36 TRINITY_DN1221_c0_g1_i2:102-2705(+)
MASKGKKKVSQAERANEAKRQTIERISQLTLWTPDDIEPVLKECNNDEAITIDKILSGDAGRPGMEWQQVSTRAARKQRDQLETQAPVYQDQQNRQNQRSGPRGGGNQRFDQTKQRASNEGRRRGPYSPGQQGQSNQAGKKGGNTQNKQRKPMGGQFNNPHNPPIAAAYSGSPGQELPSEEPSLGSQYHNVQLGLAHVGTQPVPYSQALTQGTNQNMQSVEAVRSNEVNKAPSLQSQVPETNDSANFENKPFKQPQSRSQQTIHQSPAIQENREQTPSTQVVTNVHTNNGLENLGQLASLSIPQDPLYGARGSPGAVGSGAGKRNNAKQFAGSPSNKNQVSKGRRDQPPRNQVWQAKDTASAGTIGNSASSTSARPISTLASVESKPRSDSTALSSYNPEDKSEKTEALILPSELTPDDSGDFNSVLRFGDFGSPQPETANTSEEKETHNRQDRAVPVPAHSPVVSPVISSAPARVAVSRPTTQKDEEPAQSPPTSQPSQQTASRKPASRPQQQEKKPVTAYQPSPTRPIDSAISDDGFSQPIMVTEGGHMQMPYYPHHYFGNFMSSEMDSPQTTLHHQMNYYDNNTFQGTSYRASSPHHTNPGEASPKYPYRDASKGYAQHQVTEPAEQDKHRQDADSPPHQHSSGQSSTSPPPGPHPSSQPAPHPYSIQASQYPMYSYPPYHQYSYPGTSQFPGFQRYAPMHYSKPYPSTTGAYPLSPPNSSGYGEDLDYKYSVPQQSFFMPEQSSPAGQPTSGLNPKGHTGKGQVAYSSPLGTTGDYKHLDYGQDNRSSQGYKSQYSTQPSQGYPSQYSQHSQYQQSQFPFMHTHNVPSHHFQPQSAVPSTNPTTTPQNHHQHQQQQQQQPQYS